MLFYTKDTVIKPDWRLISKSICVMTLITGSLLMSSCANKQTSYGSLENMASAYLENQRISSEMLLIAARQAESQEECRRFAGTAFWLYAIAEAEITYELWVNHPYRSNWGEPDPNPKPKSSYDFCIKYDLHETGS